MDEWQRLPWWQQRVYVEGLNWEFNPDETEVISEEDAGIVWESG